ncbi:PorV/PorQ family protein [candidate division FCPU426 bacterium]|nr:PorV/PorQ family protein [candidate division FCPU426 bacterium]
MKRQILLAGILAMACALSTHTWAEQTNFDIGKVGGSELKIGLGPRAVAMGEAFVAMADDWNATAWNPAGLAQIEGYQAGFMHNIYLEETSMEYLGYAQNLFEGAGIGANFMFLNFGTLDKVEIRNDLPEITGEFTPTVFTFALGYGQWVFPAMSVGGNIKFISQNIDTESYSAIAVDVAALFKLDHLGANGFKAGLAIQNLGSTLGDASLPMNAKAGLAYAAPFTISTQDIWNVLLDINLPFGDVNYTSANVGTEYWFSNIVAARVGYKIKDTGDLGGVTGLTAGLGAKVPMGQTTALHLDYALLSFGDLGMTHQISISAAFK